MTDAAKTVLVIAGVGLFTYHDARRKQPPPLAPRDAAE
jgi:hypothetical protein